MNFCEARFREESSDQNVKSTTDAYADHSLPLYSSWADGVSGDPPVIPHVGNQYQADIPSLMEKLSLLQLQHCPDNDNDLLDLNYCTGKELAVPIMWISHEGDSMINEQVEFPGTTFGDCTIEAHQVVSNERWPYSNYGTGTALPDSLDSYGMCSQVSMCKTESPGDQLEHGKIFTRTTSQECNPSDHQKNTSVYWSRSRETKSYVPLPGSPVSLWSNAESKSFLLGLYIYGKNLVQVKRFVESKEMGDVLSFYYGKFYRSDAHQRWVNYRKIRSKRCILGHRIFTGWRQQELLSRLQRNNLKESQVTLLEATKNFNEGRTSLEEFVSALKAMVGLEALVQAIGIGKGKQDLTGIIMDPVRTNAAIPIHPEVPVGKACSSLASSDIIKFLTGDFRLSKARSNDLFWEAVWPRLLARGWHSEQPTDLCSLGSRISLVFLVPGIKKFSRRKLVRGSHYFDSVTDVLNKVASDPELLHLETEGAEEGSKIDHGVSVSDCQRPSYLRSRFPDCNSELMKFTVVDTSLVQGEEPFNMRQLRSLPADATTARYIDSSTEQSSSATISFDSQADSVDKKVCNGTKITSSVSHHSVADQNQRLSLNGHEFEHQCCGRQIGKQIVTDTKPQFSRRVKCSGPNFLALVSKRRKLSNDNKGVCAEAKISRGKVREAVLFAEKPPPQAPVPPDFETKGTENNLNLEEPPLQSDANQPAGFHACTTTDDGRRHGTRNRPPTAKALEALACGFFGTKRSKGTKATRSSDLKPRPARNARKGADTNLSW